MMRDRDKQRERKDPERVAVPTGINIYCVFFHFTSNTSSHMFFLTYSLFSLFTSFFLKCYSLDRLRTTVKTRFNHGHVEKVVVRENRLFRHETNDFSVCTKHDD